MSRRMKGTLIVILILIAVFAPATFARLLDGGINSLFVIFGTVTENLENLPTPPPGQ